MFFIVAVCTLTIYTSCNQNSNTASNSTKALTNSVWHAPDTALWAKDSNAKLIRLGRMLVANTAYYLGSNGSIAHLSNGMNCQNCHQEAGTKAFGNNFGAVAANYPSFRPRSGKVENIYQRINECMQRSLNGKPIDTTSEPIKAIAAYINWVGKDVPKGAMPHGAGAGQLNYIDRAADTTKGASIYIQKCQLCHGASGSGLANANGIGYQYPALWGEHSYNTGASMNRIGKLATYVKNNMPFGVSYQTPQLTDEEAWDIAAYIDSQKRPMFDAKKRLARYYQ